MNDEATQIIIDEWYAVMKPNTGIWDSTASVPMVGNDIYRPMMDGSVNTKVPVHEYDFTGVLEEAKLTISEQEMEEISDDETLKQHVAIELLNVLIKNKRIAFTKTVDYQTGTVNIRAYLYATPDTQTHIIRSLKKV